MWFLGLLLPFLSSCYCHEKYNDTMWLLNEVLVTTLDRVYEQLPVSVINDNHQQSKRSFAIIAESVLLYTAINNPDPQATADQIVKLLPEPADVIGADTRRKLDILRAIIDQPINDVKRACKPNTSLNTCLEVLDIYHQEQKDKCCKYENHIKLHFIVENFMLQTDFWAFLEEAIAWTNDEKNADDGLAIQFFIDSVSKYDQLFKLFSIVYKYIDESDYPCNNLGSYSINC